MNKNIFGFLMLRAIYREIRAIIGIEAFDSEVALRFGTFISDIHVLGPLGDDSIVQWALLWLSNIEITVREVDSVVQIYLACIYRDCAEQGILALEQNGSVLKALQDFHDYCHGILVDVLTGIDRPVSV